MANNILLLQGPMGPFFKRLAMDLAELGNTVYKINFNAGDRYYYAKSYGGNLDEKLSGENCKDYSDTREFWPTYLEKKLKQWDIHCIYLFGDERSYHRAAHDVAKRLGIDVYVFEEGYLRPHYITIEKDGVNGRSSIPRDPEAYQHIDTKDVSKTTEVPYSFAHAGWYATVYYLKSLYGRHRFPHYQHHRAFKPYDEAALWIRAAFRKYYFKFRERGILQRLVSQHSKEYFLSPLQVHNDAQIKTWSSVPSAAAYIRRVISSFSKNAPENTLLVIKHHPLDRGYSDYSKLIAKLAARFNVTERVIYVHDLHLPTLLTHAKGTVLLNSTVGISSLLHGTPVIASGHAIFNIKGLTYQGKMADFWRNPGTVDRVLNQKFRNYLKMTNQINGNFYRRTPGQKNHSGIDFTYLVSLTKTQANQQKETPVTDLQPATAQPPNIRMVAPKAARVPHQAKGQAPAYISRNMPSERRPKTG